MLMLELVPPFSKIDTVHDNACGTGAMTSAIMSASLAEVHIDATDVSLQFTQGTTFAFHGVDDYDKAARQIYRTFEPDGTAAASAWVYMPHVVAMRHAQWRTRGRDGLMPTLLPLEDYQEEDLREAIVAGEFKDSKIKTYEKDFYVAIPDLVRWSQLAWSYRGRLTE
ncbi:hypothetical protein N0V90_011245 [Kalmusia sp. IMI 367209]|nr:hypothetical protein N0V90_011245 [Kalmusia sp. IMI 367209]